MPARAAGPGCRSSPRRWPRNPPPSPRVAVTRKTSTPSDAYFASVPPTPSDSSSGWASTAISLRLDFIGPPARQATVLQVRAARTARRVESRGPSMCSGWVSTTATARAPAARLQLGWPEVPLRKRPARAGLQVALEADGRGLIHELDDDVELPGPVARGVWTAPRVVVLEPGGDVGREPDIWPRRFTGVLKQVYKTFGCPHDHTRCTCAARRLVVESFRKPEAGPPTIALSASGK